MIEVGRNQPRHRQPACGVLRPPCQRLRCLIRAVSGMHTQAVVKGMQAHVADPSMQTESMTALHNVLTKGSRGATHRQKASSAGAIESVITAMKTHSGDRDLQGLL